MTFKGAAKKAIFIMFAIKPLQIKKIAVKAVLDIIVFANMLLKLLL